MIPVTDGNVYFMKSKRLGFGRWSTENLPEALKLWGDTKVTKLISRDGFSRQEIENRLSKELELDKTTGLQYWPLFLLDDDTFAGCCGFHPAENNKNAIELGYHILPVFWGKGLATEAAECCLQYARSKQKWNQVKAGHHPLNQPSARVLLKLGFERTEDEIYKPTGLMHPTYKLGL